MNTSLYNHIRRLTLPILLLATGCATSQKSAVSPPPTYPTPELAAQALVQAIAAGPEAATAVLGEDARPLFVSGDPTADTQDRDRLLAAYQQKHQIVSTNDCEAALLVGENDWPLPIPLVRTDSGWSFDAARGQDEVLSRRIGRNELDTLQVCLAIVEAQREFAILTAAGTGTAEYARKILSDPGQRNGLYWPAAPGEAASPLGPLIAEAADEGYTRSAGAFHGYRYRLLTAQGPAAPGGARDYFVSHKNTDRKNTERKLIGGFALVAYPAQYGNSGITTFIVSHDGVVHEADLGPATAKLAAAMKTYNPDSRWKVADTTPR